MDDFKILLYILFFIIYVVTRFRKKNPNKPVTPQKTNREKSSSQPNRGQTKQMTFEELLEQFTDPNKAKKNKPKEAVNPAKKKPVEERKLAKQKKLAQRTPQRQYYQEENTEKTYNQAGREKAPKKVKDIEDEDNFSQLRQMLNNPESAQQAIILSEIINRKY